VEVFAEEASAPAICEALAMGRFYASSGATLVRIAVVGEMFSVWPKQAGARVDFIGAGGEILARVRPEAGATVGAEARAEASYRLRGDERYVRARVVLPSGKSAWTQAYRVATEGAPR
jgi:hypothetical protein